MDAIDLGRVCDGNASGRHAPNHMRRHDHRDLGDALAVSKSKHGYAEVPAQVFDLEYSADDEFWSIVEKFDDSGAVERGHTVPPTLLFAGLQVARKRGRTSRSSNLATVHFRDLSEPSNRGYQIVNSFNRQKLASDFTQLSGFAP